MKKIIRSDFVYDHGSDRPICGYSIFNNLQDTSDWLDDVFVKLYFNLDKNEFYLLLYSKMHGEITTCFRDYYDENGIIISTRSIPCEEVKSINDIETTLREYVNKYY